MIETTIRCDVCEEALDGPYVEVTVAWRNADDARPPRVAQLHRACIARYRYARTVDDVAPPPPEDQAAASSMAGALAPPVDGADRTPEQAAEDPLRDPLAPENPPEDAEADATMA